MTVALGGQSIDALTEPGGAAPPVARRQRLRATGSGGVTTPSPSDPLAKDLVRFGTDEAASLRTVSPSPDDEMRSAIASTAAAGSQAQDLSYDFNAAARGRRGSIATRTVLHLHHAPEKDVLVQPYDPERHLTYDPHQERTYAVTITYHRTIAYTDDEGRTVDVDVRGSVAFTQPAWSSAMSNRTGDLTLGELAALQGSTGWMSVRVSGRGDLATVMAKRYPSMPPQIRDPILAERSSSYLALVSVTGTSLSMLSGDAALDLERTQGSFPIHLTDLPGDFVHLDRTAGRQYDTVRAYLESWDAVEIAKWVEEIKERLRNPATLVRGAPQTSRAEDGPSWLDRVLGAIGSFWNGLPAPLRGTLKVLGKAAATVGAVLGAAALVVALAPVELTVAGVALVIGAVLMIGSFFHSIYVRSLESVETGSGNPATVFLIAIGDTLGITGIVEGITNRSVLSDRPLGLDEEGRWERSVGGGLQLILTLLGARTLLRSRSPVVDVGPEPTTTAAPESPAGELASRQPLFEGLTDAEVGQAVEGAKTPSVTGGRTRPRIGGRAVPTTRRPLLDLEDIPRTAGETARQALARVNRVVTHVLEEFPALRDAWQRARAQVLAENGPLTRDNYRSLYDATRRQFWRNVRDSEQATALFEQAGFEFLADRSTAPVLRGAPPGLSAQEFRISLDHLAEKAIGDNWTRSLNADNLQMEFQNPNSYREAVQARHPDLRLSPPPAEQE